MSLNRIIGNFVPQNTIPEYFAGKVIFITGGSGFIGKVLIEKLLRSCPNISKIYMLIRPKCGKSVEERLEDILSNSLFGSLKNLNPTALNKIEPMQGDIAELELGLSEENKNKIINNVHIVYHIAATIKFNEPLEKSIILNVRGTREVCKLALTIKKLLVFNHVSTAYCQLDKYTIDEQLYPSVGNWKEMIEIAESFNPNLLKMITSKLTEGFPNTYTFTKSLAESTVHDLCERKIPTIIHRPTIVVGTYEEPIPGWTDNINGLAGLCVVVLKGLIRVVYCTHEIKMDCIPADALVAGFIKATWIHQYLKVDEVFVYNCSGGDLFYGTPDLIQRAGWDYIDKYSPEVFWYPNIYITHNLLIYHLFVYLFQILPAVLIDFVLYILRKEPKVLNYQRKIYRAMSSLDYFMKHDWYISNNNFVALDDYLHPSDNKSFQKDIGSFDEYECILICTRGAITELLHEDPNNQIQNRKILNRMKYITYTFKTIMCFAMFGIIYKYFFIPGIYAIYDYFRAL